MAWWCASCGVEEPAAANAEHAADSPAAIELPCDIGG